jgi:HK97 family phage major capsid protein
MATKKELNERRNEMYGDIQRMRDLITEVGDDGSERGFQDNEREQWDRINGDYDTVMAELQAIEDQEAIHARMSELETHRRQISRSVSHTRRDAPNEEDRALALQAWFLRGKRATLTERHQEACRRLSFDPSPTEIEIDLCRMDDVKSAQMIARSTHESQVIATLSQHFEKRNLAVSVGATGGFAAPQGFVNSLEVNMLAFGGMLQVADIMRTDSGNDLPWPTANDTSNTGEQLGEGASIGSSVDPTFAQKIFRAYKFSSKLIKISTELMEDSAFDMASVIGRLAGERLGRISNTKFTTGTGAGTPKGITLSSTAGVTTASSTAIAFDEVFNLIHSVDPAYRTGSSFMMHDNVVLYMRKLKNGMGDYLWQSGLQLGVPDRILSFPYVVNQDMSSTITSGDITIEFGDLSKYKVRQVRGVRFVRLNELYAGTDEVAFIAFLRQDGDLLDAGTAPVKHIVQV